MKWEKLLHSLFLFILYCRQDGKVGIGRVTVDKNIVKDFYHIPTYIIYFIYKGSVVGKWYASMWTGVVKENHIWWNTINQGINFHLYVKNVPLLISSFISHQWVIELSRNYTTQIPYTCNVSWHIFRVIE